MDFRRLFIFIPIFILTICFGIQRTHAEESGEIEVVQALDVPLKSLDADKSDPNLIGAVIEQEEESAPQPSNKKAPASKKPGTEKGCPDGMAAVKEQYCIDRYEYPNVEGETPLTYITWTKAAELCAVQNKRLCSFEEWKTACSGPKKLQYPYGDKYRDGICNDGRNMGEIGVMPSGTFDECASGYGVYDMSGNVWEWVDTPYAGGETKGIQGGSPVSNKDESFACTQPSADDPRTVYEYDGFRCCMDYPDKMKIGYRSPKSMGSSDVSFSPLMGGRPSSSAPEGVYAGAEHFRLGNLMRDDTINKNIEIIGNALTVGYKFNEWRIDYTRVEYKMDERNNTTYNNQTEGHNVWHAAYTIPNLTSVVSWAETVTVGVRRFDNTFGNVTETYFLNETRGSKVVSLHGFNYLVRSNRNNKLGVVLDFRFHLSERVDALLSYNSADFYKSVINEYYIPYSSLASSFKCTGCGQDATSAGVSYRFPNGRGRFYFLAYDMGDLFAPAGGAVINF